MYINCFSKSSTFCQPGRTPAISFLSFIVITFYVVKLHSHAESQIARNHFWSKVYTWWCLSPYDIPSKYFTQPVETFHTSPLFKSGLDKGHKTTTMVSITTKRIHNSPIQTAVFSILSTTACPDIPCQPLQT
jgi:hypothetical protein